MTVPFQNSEHALGGVDANGSQQVRLRRRFTALLVILTIPAIFLAFLYILKDHHYSYSLVFHGIVEDQEVRLASKEGGRVAEVLVEEGQWVTAGTVLVRFDAPELHAEQVQVKAQLQIAQARLEQARNTPLPEEVDSARASLEVAQAHLADLEAGYRAQEIAQARLDVEVMQAEAARAQTEYERMKRLYTDRIISASEYDAARTLMQSTNGKLGMARQRLDQFESGHREDAITQAQAQVRKSKAELQRVLRGVRSEELQQMEAQVQEAKARIDLIEARIAETQVLAPADCLVSVLPVRRGQIVGPQETVVKVRAPEDRWIKAFVPETELHRLAVDQPVTLLRDHDSRRHVGKITYIASDSEFTPRNVQSINERQHQVFAVKVKPIDDAGVFKSGMAARVVLQPSSDNITMPSFDLPAGVPVSASTPPRLSVPAVQDGPAAIR